jgi:hypothetical protein
MTADIDTFYSTKGCSGTNLSVVCYDDQQDRGDKNQQRSLVATIFLKNSFLSLLK